MSLRNAYSSSIQDRLDDDKGFGSMYANAPSASNADTQCFNDLTKSAEIWHEQVTSFDSQTLHSSAIKAGVKGNSYEWWYDPFARAIEHFAATTQEEAAKELLAKGIHIYYGKDDTPDGLLIKEYPDGRRELVRFHRDGDEVIKALWTNSPRSGLLPTRLENRRNYF